MAETTNDATAVAIPPRDRADLEQLRTAGAVAVERKKILSELERQLAGMSFGEVSGDRLSPHTRYAIAQICVLTGANPALHFYILGNRLYLNADFWGQKAAQQPHHLGYEQIPLLPGFSAELRKQADEADQQGDAEDARRLRRLARHVDTARVGYGIPDGAKAAYETVIRRYSENAPLAAIRAGRVDPSPFIIEVREANWCGGVARKKPDPVGEDRPAETARSRSLRRAAVRAYSTTLAPVENELRRLEDAVEAEFEVVATDGKASRAALPGPDGQAVRAAGEPEGVNATGAQELPRYGEPRAMREAAKDGAAEPPSHDLATTDLDLKTWRKRHFATLRDAGISTDDEARREWYRQNGLPASTQEWGVAEFQRADEVLVGPLRANFQRGCEIFGQDEERFAMEVLGALPTTYRDYQSLNAELNKLEAGGGDPGLGL